jgi:phospholipid N-methyltransferase
MHSFNTFVRQSFKDFMNVGAFVPSTPFLAKRIMKGVNSTTVIELGPGTGVFTREILRKLPENGRLICIE